MKKVMITGATGNLGSQVLQSLIQKLGSKSLYAIARDTSKLDTVREQGVTVIQADYDDKESLVKAFQDIDLLYFVSGSDIVKRMEQHGNVVAAAKEAGVKHVVYTSFQRKNETDSSPIFMVAKAHIFAEQLLKASGLNYTILKHALYSDVIPMFLGPDVLEKGIIYQPAGDGKVAFTSRSDMAKAAVAVLIGEGHENKTYEISVNRSYSYNDIAEILGEISGKKVIYVSPSASEFKETLSKVGVPEGIVAMVSSFSEGIRQGEFDFPSTDLEKLIGEKPENISDYLSKVYLQ